MVEKYDIARNPKDNLWYVIGCCGRNQAGRMEWMAVTKGLTTKAAAIARMKHLYQAHRAMIAELIV